VNRSEKVQLLHTEGFSLGQLNNEGQEEQKPSQAKILIDTAKEKCTFFKGYDDKTYASIMVNDHYENWEIKSSYFKNWLTKEFYIQKEKPPNSTAVADAVKTLQGISMFDTSIPHREVFFRVGGDFKEMYIDLLNSEWEVVKITSSGWEVIKQSRVMFRRCKAMKQLPKPVKGGSIDLLRKYVSCKGDDFVLFVSWLLGSLSPKGPYPLMIMQGTQGSGKSTHSKVARALVDPSSSPIRSTPKNEQDLMIQANNAWVLAFDNLSGIKAALSDSFCKLATGGGFSTRELYSNDEETIFTATRPCILNGIDDIATRGDLADRSLIINLASIEEDERKLEQEFWKDFEVDQPYILGAIFDILVACLRNLEYVKLDKLPRMADFARWASAGEQAAGFQEGAFINAYWNNKRKATDTTLQSDIFIPALISLVNDFGEWSGSAAQLLNEALKPYVPEHVRKSSLYPKQNKLKGKIDRFKPDLKSIGIHCEHYRKNSGAVYSFRKINNENTITTYTTDTEYDHKRSLSDSSDGSDDNNSFSIGGEIDLDDL
jgi:hypothetical protein